MALNPFKVLNMQLFQIKVIINYNNENKILKIWKSRKLEINLMAVTVIKGENKKNMELNGNKTVKDLLEMLDVPSETVVVKKNDCIVIDEEPVKDGDTVEIIQVIYGG